VENKELEKALGELKYELEGKSKSEVKSAIDAFETKYKAHFEKTYTDQEDLENMRVDIEEKMAEMQKHYDKLDVKLQSSQIGSKKENPIVKMIHDNFDLIKTVRKGNSLKLESKTVANMTIGAHLTGDEPRTYSFDVATIPGQAVNVADLVGLVNIGTGVYTYPRETGGEGSISAQTEGSAKTQKDYDLTLLDVNPAFIAGYARYSKQMANSLPFLESWLPRALTRDYWTAENSAFNTTLSGAATASSVVITGQNKVEMIIDEIAALEGSNYMPNAIVVRPADFYDILVTEKSTGAGYGLPGIVTFDGGQLRVNGIPVYRVNWMAANKYYVGDFSRVNKVVREGLSLDFSEHDATNFTLNLITARIEAQVALAVEQPAAVVYGDFTST